MSLWAEIKQRRITQIVFGYLAGGWVVLAVLDQVVDRQVVPPVVYRVGLTLYLFGILVALILGWYHGEKGHQNARPLELVMVTLVCLAGLGMSARIVMKEMRASAAVAAINSSTMDLHRIAVLYFTDQSADGSLSPVADALTDGLITSLSKVRALSVVSRNGSQSVRDLSVTPDSIASILDAGTIIQGSVSEADAQLKVSVRLLDGQSGTPVRSDTYTWPADSLASVGDRLAQEVARSLRVFVGTEIKVQEGRKEAPSAEAWLQLARGQKSFREGIALVRQAKGPEAAAAFEQADATLSGAEALDKNRTWVEPLILRGRVTYERLPLAESSDEAVATLARAVTFADSALALEPGNAEALELRGTVRYRRWLSRLDDDPKALDALLAGAKSDLEKSVDPEGSASAYSTLSHLYYQVGDPSSAAIAAQRAYEEDAFLTVADGVLWRLYSANYDLENYDKAQQWCAEGYRRFPDNFRFVQCQLFLMTMSAAKPDVDEAWRLYRQLVPELPEEQAVTLDHQAQTVVGGIIGRAGMADSANTVLVKARLTPQQDPEGELMSIEAAMRALMGDKEGAIELLKRYVVKNPGHFAGRAGLSWWWRSLQGDPEFEKLRTLS